MNVPFLDLKAQYHALKDEIHAAIDEVMEKTAFAGGPFVAGFEKEFAKFCDCKHAIGVGNGTDALWLSLLALGIGPGDEVITVPNTFIATAEAITYCGAKPVFVDVDEKTYNMNPALLEAAITPRTKAIIPVHLFGQTADMDPILAVAKAHRLPSSKTPARPTAPSTKAERPAPWASPAASASIRERTWAPMARPAPS